MNRYCDKYAECNSVYLDWSNDLPSDDALRVRGWRVWAGLSLTGQPLSVCLCDKCCKSSRMTKVEVLEGQEELF